MDSTFLHLFLVGVASPYRIAEAARADLTSPGPGSWKDRAGESNFTKSLGLGVVKAKNGGL